MVDLGLTFHDSSMNLTVVQEQLEGSTILERLLWGARLREAKSESNCPEPLAHHFYRHNPNPQQRDNLASEHRRPLTASGRKKQGHKLYPSERETKIFSGPTPLEI